MADYARGERLRELRDAKHASQETVAFAIGVSTKTVRSWEHGGKIRWPNAKLLGRYYGVDPEALVARDAAAPLPEDEASETPETQLDRIEQQVSDLHGLFFGESGDDEAAVADLAARLLQAAESPPPRAADRAAIRAAAAKRRRA
jgi:transcriptional regulator with XRE-family HTH domain